MLACFVGRREGVVPEVYQKAFACAWRAGEQEALVVWVFVSYFTVHVR